MDKQCKVLLVADKNFDIDEVMKCINVNITDFAKVTDSNITANFFDTLKPDIVIFHHPFIAISEEMYAGLRKNSKSTQAIKHRAILMCDSNDIPQAIESCTNHVFFDYVVFNPDTDRMRINLIIRKALESIAHEKDTSESPPSVNEISSNSPQSQDLPTGQHSVNHVASIIEEAKEMIDSSTNRFNEKLAADGVQNEGLPSKSNSSASGPKKVMLVEDNEIYSEMVKLLLESTDAYKVTVIASVFQGILLLIREKPDIILLDYELEDGDAGEFLEKLATVDSVKDTPVIMLTSQTTNDVYTTTSMLGARAFIRKPASKEIIITEIEKCLGSD